MLKVGKRVTSVIIILSLIFSLVPIRNIVSAESTNAFQANDFKLYQVTGEKTINEKVIVYPNSYLYGVEKKEYPNKVFIQYGTDRVAINKEKLTEVDIDKETAPSFVEINHEDLEEVIFNEKQFLYNNESGQSFQIAFSQQTSYPIVNEGQNGKAFYIGNVAYDIDESQSENETSQDADKVTDEVKPDTPQQEQLKEKRKSSNLELDKKEHGEGKIVDALSVSNPWKTSNAQYFKVDEEKLPVYDNRSGENVEVGYLKLGQVYPRISSYGPNWHKIQYGDIYGYVYAPGTTPVDGKQIKNKNSKYENQSRNFTALQDVKVYDNTSGDLVPFGVIKKGKSYPIVSNYGNWWRVLLSDRVGYVNKDAVKVEISSSDEYFRVLTDNVPIYDNRSGKLVKVGELTEGQVYPRISSYGPNWHKIQFGNITGYVYASDTEAATGKNIKNQNNKYENSEKLITPLEKVSVYDNSSGKLVEIGKLLKGKSYPIVSDYGNWWRIIFSDRIGYVHKNAVRTNFSSKDEYFRVLTDNLPIYDNRSGKLIKVGELAKGQVYPRISDYGPNWHKVEYGNINGYVYADETESASGTSLNNEKKKYSTMARSITPLQDTPVYDNSSGKLVEFATLREGKPYPKVSNYGNWWRVVVAGREGFVHKDAVKHNFRKGDKYFKVITEDLPVYDNRGKGLQKVGELRKGQTYPIVSNYGNWWRVQFGNVYGYVHKSGTEYGYQSDIKNLNTLYSKSNGLNIVAINDVVVHEKGSLTPFGELKGGTKYPVSFDYGNWWGIIYSDRVGFVQKNEVYKEFSQSDQSFITTRDTPLYINENGDLITVATLYKGNTFHRVEDYGNWHKVRLGNRYAYIWKKATAPKNEPINIKASTGIVSTIKDTKLYNDKQGSGPVASIQAGQKIPLIKKIDDQWSTTAVAGKTLYIKNDYIINLEKYSFHSQTNKNIDTIRTHILDTPFIGDNEKTPENETVQAADLILDNKILFPEFCKDPKNNDCPMNYENGIDWVHGEGVSKADQNSFLRQLHGMFFINDLAEAYRTTGNDNYIKKGYQIIQNWKAENPYTDPSHYMAWHDEGTARRLSALVNLFDSGKDVLTKRQQSNLFMIMIQHADLLASDHFYSENTNHGMFQDEALIGFSKYFYEFPVMDDYYQLAVSRMEGYFDSLISKDFVHLEHSPSYHQTIASAIRSYGLTINEFGDTGLANKFLSRYQKMVDYATHVIKPDGTWPLIADTYENKNNPSRNMWQENPYYLYASTNGQSGEMPQVTNKVYPDAGYAVFRDRWTNTDQGTYVFFTAAYHTSYHKHSDDLSVWIYNDEDIISEAGPYSYLLTEPTTKYAYSSYAHNTLIVDDKGLPRVDGKFNRTYIENYDLSNDKAPSVTGVNKRYDGVTHKRQLTYEKANGFIRVRDQISSDSSRNLKLLWHLAPNVVPSINNDNNKIVLKKDGQRVMEIDISGSVDPKIKSVYGNEDPIYKSWYFEYSKQTKGLEKVNTHTLIIEYEGQNALINTSFNLMK
ncbi:alginate lyase family protein [Salinibacillus xinjiangensis]|uniref:SH3b domain-containing protein n=1 Tax=Salinibacillus xinjiangensis TaxID=1229268 RepID=A0A6G1X2C6_9BACI|nr:alginate lyase family protein [Salinibacillus xinjiangensis]MRG85079.1 hypothetical protein [Salinibacillus xinjiangensis]